MSLRDRTGDGPNYKNIFSRIMDTTGVGSGTKNANGNYASAAEEFKIDCPEGQLMEVARMLVQIRDTGAMAAEEYGAIAELTNGVTLKIFDGSDSVVDLTDGVPITTNAGWGRLCYDVDVKTWSTGDEVLLARLTFSKFGQPICLRPGHSLRVTLNDDLTGLGEHYFTVQGAYLPV